MLSVRKIYIILLGIGLIISYSPAQAAETLDLEATYQAALRYATTISLSQAQLKEAESRYHQVLGKALPRVSFRASEFFQADPGSAGTGVPNTFVRTERPELSLNATLPSFRGFKELQILKGANLETDRRRQLEREARKQLYRDVMNAYFNAVLVEQDLQIIDKLLAVLRERASELAKRVKLGKTRQSEQLTQETDMDFLEAEWISQQSAKKAAYQLLSLLTGIAPQPKVILINDTPPAPMELAAYQAKTLTRSDVMAAELAWQIAKKARSSAYSDYLPYLDAEANYYFYRVGFQEDVDWDASLRLTVPIFNWETYGTAQVAASKLTQEELFSIETRRQAEHSIKVSYQHFVSSRERFAKYNDAATKAAKNYQLEVADYRRGLISNLEVMQVQRTWLEALRQRNNSQIASWVDQYTLDIESAKLPKEHEVNH